VKKLLWLFVIFAAATAVREAVDYFGPMAAAFRAYREEAHKQALERGKKKSFRHIEGNIVKVSHKLESSERPDEDTVRLVVLEAVHFQKSSERGRSATAVSPKPGNTCSWSASMASGSSLSSRKTRPWSSTSRRLPRACSSDRATVSRLY